MTTFDFPSTRDSATANRIEKNTICSTSLSAAALKKLVGTVCVRTEPHVGAFLANALNSAPVPAVSATPTPGLSQFTKIKPMASASVVTISKYTMDRQASRPTFFMSSPCPAIPTISVENSSGTMIDLIIDRKMSENGLSAFANSGACQPSRIPTTMAITIHCDCDRPNNPFLPGTLSSGNSVGDVLLDELIVSVRAANSAHAMCAEAGQSVHADYASMRRFALRSTELR